MKERKEEKRIKMKIGVRSAVTVKVIEMEEKTSDGICSRIRK